MSCSNYDELVKHFGHKIVCVKYAEENVSIECEDCCEVIIDFEKGV